MKYLLILLFGFFSFHFSLDVKANSVKSTLVLIDTLKLDQKTVDFVYNKAIDLIIRRHPKVFETWMSEGKLEVPLFNITKDRVIVRSELESTCAFSPDMREIICDSPEEYKKLQCQTLFTKAKFLNTFPIIRNSYANDFDIQNSDIYTPDIVIDFSNICQFRNKLFLEVNVFWFIKNSPQDRGRRSTQNLFELEICKGDQIYFTKLFTNITGGDFTEENTVINSKEEIIYKEHPDGLYYNIIPLYEKPCDK